MMEELLEMLREYEQNDEIFETLARMMRKMYDALIKAGFTPEQAMQIVASQGAGIKSS